MSLTQTTALTLTQICILTLFLLTPTTQATTYYVDAANGSDTRNGLAPTPSPSDPNTGPFATIQHAINTAGDGNPTDPNLYQVLRVAAGTYQTDPVFCNHDGQHLIFAPGAVVEKRCR